MKIHHVQDVVSETQFEFEIPNSGTTLKILFQQLRDDAHIIIRLRPMAFSAIHSNIVRTDQ
jgi:hypothetical protein